MKKFLAAFLAVLMLFSASCITVFAEEETTETTTEPEVTTKEYEICEDTDFSSVVYLDAGNEKATILKPGDTIFTYKSTSSTSLKIDYYPDADAVAKGDWVAQDTNNLAFSPSATAFKRDEFKKLKGQDKSIATIKDVDFTDFTIAYSDENEFIGWVVYEFVPTANQIKVYGVWEKNHKVSVEDDSDDFEYIVNKLISFWKALFKPFTAAINFISNGFLYIGNFFHELILGNKTVA